MATTRPTLVVSRAGSASPAPTEHRLTSPGDIIGGKVSADTDKLQQHTKSDRLSLAANSGWAKLMKIGETSSSRNGRRASSASRVTSSRETADGQSTKVSGSTLSNVFASFGSMSLMRQKVLINTGNTTTNCPLRKFDAGEVEVEMQRILATALKGMTYDAQRSSVLAKGLSDSIRGKLKQMKYPRYKFAVMVTMTSNSQQAFAVGSRCLWNSITDASASVSFTNDYIHAVATVFAVLQE